MPEPLAIAKIMGIPIFVFFDSDAHIKDNKKGNREKHRKDNSTILNLCSYIRDDPMPKDTLWKDNLVMWKSELNKIVDDEIANDEYEKIKDSVRHKYGMPQNVEKYGLFIAECLTIAWNKGLKSNSLIKLCKYILEFAKNN